ncbi:unnamed protein product [Amoebophrya sp. A25]|nr:unnamed protein product [Amoebophrya sp. A25]|eukprot:GSA25T00019714001.1
MFKTATAKGGRKYETANRGEEERREEGSEVRAQVKMWKLQFSR